MAYVYSLAERARVNLSQAATCKNIDLRRLLGHAMVLDTLLAELSVSESMRDETDLQRETEEESNEDDLSDNIEESGDSDLDSEDSDLDSDSDSDSDSDWDPETESDSDSELRHLGPGWLKDFNLKIPENFSDDDEDDSDEEWMENA